MAGSVDNASADVNAAFNASLGGSGTNYSQGGISASTIADNFARAAYNNALAAGVGESNAINRAKLEWQKQYDSAVLSGYFNDKPTLARQEFEATATGTYDGKPTEATREFNVGASGYLDDARQQATLAREAEQNKTALGYLQILAGLRGPQNAFQYARVLNGTPNGLSDIVNAASGRYGISSFGGGAPPAVPNASTNGASVGPNGELSTTPNAGASLLPQTGGSAAPVPMGEAGLDTLIGDANNPARVQPPSTAPLPLPNQIDPVAFSKYSPTQKSLLSGAYESQGWDPLDVEAIRKASLPAFRGPARGAVGGLFAA